MKIHYSAMAVLILLILGSCRSENRETDAYANAFTDAKLRDIYTASDRREPKELLLFANAETAAYRMAFAKVAGSVLDTALLAPLEALLNDPVASVSLSAAFSVGQFRDSTSLPQLQNALYASTLPEIKAELLEAIGKSADVNAMEFLISHDPVSPAEESGKVWGIYQASLKGLLKERHIPIVVAHLASGSAESRLGAAHILARQKAYSIESFKNEIDSFFVNETDLGIRAIAVQILAKAGSTDATLADLALRDPDSRVRAEAVRLMAKPNSPEGRKAILSGLEDGSVWVAMSAAARYQELDEPLSTDAERSLALTSKVPEVRSALILSNLLRYQSDDGGVMLWKEVAGRYTDPIANAVVYSKLGSYESALNSVLDVCQNDGVVGTAATEALIAGARSYEDWKKAFYQNANEAFAKGLLAQTYLYASALQEDEFRDTSKVSIETLRAGLSKFQKAGEAETRNEIIKAIIAMGGDVGKKQIFTAHPLDWELIQSISIQATAKIYALGHVLEMRLLVEDAPGSVSNFVALAESGFYDGRSFHRIVPVFVSQGGGPRGDGYGNTDYSIRSEFSPLHYGAGVAGLASAGRDTEGCQFFFTHLSTPHLNGRYTIFGAITAGFDELDEIYTGAKIDSIRVIR